MADQNSQFYAILTNVGAAKQANADALGIAWKITQLGVGDANGTEPTPNATQTALIAEWRRAPLNQLKVDDNDSSIIVAEQIIPAEVGGKWIREIGLYDADGDLVAVANCPPTYKPLLSQGSGRTQVVRMNLIVSSSSNVELKIDPSVVLATREWVTSELAKQDFKHSVVAATTANITLSGLQTIDGVALTAGSRVLVKNQTAGKDNGLYVVASAAWTRSADADSGAEVTPGMLVLVERGTVNGDSAWQLVTDAPITLGVTALAYEMAFGRSGVAAGTYRSVTVDAYGRVVAATNPTTVAGYGLTDVYTKTQIDQALALKAPLASPSFTGIPLVPTAALNTNTQQIANTAFVLAQINDSLPTFAAGDTTTDWNTITTRGWFKNLLSGPSTPNSPGSAAPYWYCHVLRYLANCTQIAYPYGTPSATGLIAHRSLYQGTWTEWSISYGSGSVSAVVSQFMAATTQAAAQAALGAAPLASPALSGVPTAPTAAAATNTTQIATTAFVQAAVAALVASSPAALDTLNELAAALGNDPNFATSMATALSLKAPLASPALSGNPTAPTPAASDKDTSIATTAFVRSAMALFGLGSEVADTPLITDFSLDLRPGLYRAYTSGSPQASIGAPPDTGNTSMSVLVSGGYITSGYKTFFAIINAYAVTRVFVGVKVTEGEQPIWTEITQHSQLPFRGLQNYKAAGVFTWTVPAGVKKAWVTVIGGGGGGGCSVVANNLGSGGGGAGGLSQRLVDLSGITSVSVTVGAGGAGATTAGNAGGSGGTSSFGAYLSATGGAGGGGNSTVGNAPGTGGRGSGGDHNTSLGAGSTNYGINGGTGGGPGPRATQGAVSGSDALDSGGGGSGAYPGYAGGSGSAGCVIIQW